MKLGDRVLYQGESYPDLVGKQGILMQSMRGYAGVAFDEEVPEGHNLNGKCEDRHGLYLPIDEVGKVPKFAVGDYLYCVAPDRYGWAGTVMEIMKNDQLDTFFYKLSGDAEAFGGINEKNLRCEADYKVPPFAMEDCLMLKSDMEIHPVDLGYIEHLTGAPLSIIEMEFNPDNDEFFVTVGINGCSYTTKASNLRLATQEEIDDRYFIEAIKQHSDKISETWGKGILRDASPCYTDSEMAKKIVIAMTKMVSVEQMSNMDVMNYFENVNVSYREWDCGDASEGTTWHKWDRTGLRNVVYFLPLIHGEETRQSFLDWERDYIGEIYEDGTAVEVSDDDSCAEGAIYFYDPFSPDSLFQNIISHAHIHNEEIKQAMEEKRYGDAIEIFITCNKEFENKLLAKERAASIVKVIDEIQNQEEKRAEEQKENIDSEIRRLEDSLRDYYLKRREYELIVLGAKQDTGKTKDLERFLTGMGDNLVSLEYTNNTLTMQIKQPLLYFDTDLFDHHNIKENWRKHAYDRGAIQIIDDIVHSKIQLMFEETVAYNFRTGHIKCMQGDNSGYCRKVKDGISNPHHLFYNCWGNNETPIIKAFNEGNYLVGINQIISAIAGINLTDGAVMSRFIGLIADLEKGVYNFWNNNPCIYVYETGEIMSIKEYYESYVKSTL